MTLEIMWAPACIYIRQNNGNSKKIDLCDDDAQLFSLLQSFA